jgi:hypothetical protein
MDQPTKRRLLAVGALASALAHAFTPRLLLESVETWYTEGLRAEFEPSEETVRRVRWLAVPNLLAAVYYWVRADST